MLLQVLMRARLDVLPSRYTSFVVSGTGGLLTRKARETKGLTVDSR